MSRARLALVLTLLAVAAAVAVALRTVGGPGTARLERYDERRVRDVAELVELIERHRIFAGRLPESLEAVRAGRSGAPSIRDPETGDLYEYQVLGERRFRVCTRLAAPDAAPPMPGPVRMGNSRRTVTVMADSEGGLCWESTEPLR